MAGDQRAGRGHADEDRPGPGADAGAGFLAERGVRLVADHDRVGVGDFLVVADEPLVGLDRHRAVGVIATVHQRRAQALLVTAVGDLADELVDEVAAVGEDQDAAGPGRLDEADRGDGLAGAGRVLEPEAARGAGVLGRLLDDLLFVLGRGFAQSWGSSSSSRARVRRRRLRVLVLFERLFVGSRLRLRAVQLVLVGLHFPGGELDGGRPSPAAARPSARPACRRARRPDAG